MRATQWWICFIRVFSALLDVGRADVSKVIGRRVGALGSLMYESENSELFENTCHSFMSLLK